MICLLKGLVFHRDASHLWWENDLKERALGKAEVGMTEGGIGSCLGKTQQKAADCLKLLREAQTTSNIARLNILSSTEIFLWLGWNPFQSCACDMRGGELSMPCHLSSSCPLQAGRGLIVGLPSHSRFLGMSDARLLGNNNGTKPGKIQPICHN